MIKEFHFRFDELVIDHRMIPQVMGYGDGPLPDPFRDYYEIAFNESAKIAEPGAVIRIIESFQIDRNRKTISVEGMDFVVGSTIIRELKNSERLVFFVCTAGKTISKKSSDLLMGEDPVLGYVYDILGSAIAEAACEKIKQYLREDVAVRGETITNSYSPGYCSWDVGDQHKLFSLFGGSAYGVTLTPSALMHPVKSISGLIGIGEHVFYRDYPCQLCSVENCTFRRANISPDYNKQE